MIGEEFIGNDSCALVLGDNIFFGQGFSPIVKKAAKIKKGAEIFGYLVKDPREYGVVEFDEKRNEILFHCYSPWVEKKRKILQGEIPNEGILLPDEMCLFPFDKLCNRMKDTDNITVKMNFNERFGEIISQK